MSRESAVTALATSVAAAFGAAAVAAALAFVTGGTQRFAAHVHHPGSVIPAFAYLGGALESMRSEIEDGLKQAVLDALGV
jgi:hypothetical protein